MQKIDAGNVSQAVLDNMSINETIEVVCFDGSMYMTKTNNNEIWYQNVEDTQ